DFKDGSPVLQAHRHLGLHQLRRLAGDPDLQLLVPPTRPVLSPLEPLDGGRPAADAPHEALARKAREVPAKRRSGDAENRLKLLNTYGTSLAHERNDLLSPHIGHHARSLHRRSRRLPPSA